uniref:Peptidase M14 domain containing protein n=1 Tax=Haemonchus contortus TaxID=6289 RepID=W6NCV9_HAECO
MVDKKYSDNLLDPLKKYDIAHIKTINDVQKLINIKERRKRPRRLQDESSTPFYDFNRYGSYAQMTSWMRALARNNPQLVQFITIGTSHEGRSIDGVEIGGHDRSKRIFWIDGGIHAREWAAPHTALYFIHQGDRLADELRKLNLHEIQRAIDKGGHLSMMSKYDEESFVTNDTILRLVG